MLEAPPAVRVAQEHAGERGRDASADGGQARPGRRPGRGLGPFPRAAGAAERRTPPAVRRPASAPRSSGGNRRGPTPTGASARARVSETGGR